MLDKEYVDIIKYDNGIRKVIRIHTIKQLKEIFKQNKNIIICEDSVDYFDDDFLLP